jgi:hypothetical protein
MSLFASKEDALRGRIELSDDDMKPRKGSTSSRQPNVIKLSNDGRGLFIDRVDGDPISLPAVNAFTRKMISGDWDAADNEDKSVTKQTVRALRDICNAGL